MKETPPKTAGKKIANKMARIDSTKYTLEGRQSDLNTDFIFIFNQYKLTREMRQREYTEIFI